MIAEVDLPTAPIEEVFSLRFELFFAIFSLTVPFLALRTFLAAGAAYSAKSSKSSAASTAV